MRLDVSARLHGLLPEGRRLPEDVWRRRHRLIVQVALVQAVVLAGLGNLVGAVVFVSTSYWYLFLRDKPVEEKATAGQEPAERA